MKIYRSIKSIGKFSSGSVVAVGIFDGIHRGHIRIIKTLVRRSKKMRAKSVIVTFYPHPLSILHPDRPVPLLMSLPHRLKFIEVLGVDAAVLLKFNKRFARMKPESFMVSILKKKLGMREIVVGKNFTFGWHASGDVKLLKDFSKKYDFVIRKAGLRKRRERVISSTYIRSLIIKGKLKEAARLLGRPVSILGTVRPGTRQGRILGFPTANIDPHHEAIPASGVYAVYVKLGKRCFKGIVNIGFRPTFHRGDSILYPPEPTIEVHIFDFNKDIYGRDLEVVFVKRLRPEKRFQDRERLKRRIMLDQKAAKRFLRISCHDSNYQVY